MNSEELSQKIAENSQRIDALERQKMGRITALEARVNMIAIISMMAVAVAFIVGLML